MLNPYFRSLFILLSVILFLFSSVSYDEPEETIPTSQTEPPVTEPQETTAAEKSQPGDVIIEIRPNTSTGKNNLHADTFIQSVLSWVYSLEIRIEEEIVYLNDIPYKKVSSFTAPTIVYGDEILSKAKQNQLTYDTLIKIQNSEPCYILEAEQNDAYGKQLIVYEIDNGYDNSYYYVQFFEDGTVARIHRAIIYIKQELGK